MVLVFKKAITKARGSLCILRLAASFAESNLSSVIRHLYGISVQQANPAEWHFDASRCAYGDDGDYLVVIYHVNRRMDGGRPAKNGISVGVLRSA